MRNNVSEIQRVGERRQKDQSALLIDREHRTQTEARGSSRQPKTFWQSICSRHKESGRRVPNIH